MAPFFLRPSSFCLRPCILSLIFVLVFLEYSTTLANWPVESAGANESGKVDTDNTAGVEVPNGKEERDDV